MRMILITIEVVNLFCLFIVFINLFVNNYEVLCSLNKNIYFLYETLIKSRLYLKY